MDTWRSSGSLLSHLIPPRRPSLRTFQHNFLLSQNCTSLLTSPQRQFAFPHMLPKGYGAINALFTKRFASSVMPFSSIKFNVYASSSRGRERDIAGKIGME